MIQRLITWARGVFAKMRYVSSAKQACKVDVAIDSNMQLAIDKWGEMFRGVPPWVGNDVKSLDLAGGIAKEVARLITVEMDSTITGSQRAEFLQADYKVVTDNLRRTMELGVAGGGLVFKPYLDSGRIAVEAVPAWRFLPTGFNSRGEVTGAVFVEQVAKGKRWYTRMEHHQLTDKDYTIRNYAYSSHDETTLGVPCSLSSVDEWAALEPELVIGYDDGTPLRGALFAYFKMPDANHIDPASPLGVSVYSRGVGLIEEADRQYSRTLWEYEGSELAVDASQGALTVNKQGKPVLPHGKKRLFRELGIDGGGGDLYKVFSPAIRDEALFNGLNKLFRRIEFACGLAYGTISDLQEVEKTAEEIRASKQRSYSAVCEMQKSLQVALEHLVWVMDLYTTLYNLAPRGDYEIQFTWGDGILENMEAEFMRRKALADGEYITKEAFLMWYLGVSEEEAKAMRPTVTATSLFGDG